MLSQKQSVEGSKVVSLRKERVSPKDAVGVFVPNYVELEGSGVTAVSYSKESNSFSTVQVSPLEGLKLPLLDLGFDCDVYVITDSAVLIDEKLVLAVSQDDSGVTSFLKTVSNEDGEVELVYGVLGDYVLGVTEKGSSTLINMTDTVKEKLMSYVVDVESGAPLFVY